MGGWSREAVKNYKSLQKIDSEAWEIIGTGFKNIVPDDESDDVPESGTGVPKSSFSENLLRNILDLDAGRKSKNWHLENRKSISYFPVSDFIDKCTYLTACTDSPTTWDAADQSGIFTTLDIHPRAHGATWTWKTIPESGEFIHPRAHGATAPSDQVHWLNLHSPVRAEQPGNQEGFLSSRATSRAFTSQPRTTTTLIIPADNYYHGATAYDPLPT